jgi:hypothetical protein
MDDTEASTTPLATPDIEFKGLLGMFDVPSFVRRGQDVERASEGLIRRLAAVRVGYLEMVQLRLRQWAALAIGPDDWQDTFDAPIGDLWEATRSAPPAWSPRSGSRMRRRSVARDLVASVERFNQRWSTFLSELNLEPINRRIEDYNRYYVLEKECVLGSQKLAMRWFMPLEPILIADLEARLPALPVPALRGR